MHRFISSLWLGMALLVLAGGCAAPSGEPPVATPVPPTAPAAATADARIVVLGDSLAAGLGLPEDQAFPAVVEARLRDAGFAVTVVNAGVSGDTTAGGLRRLDWILGQQPDLVVVELGGNDALRGQPLEGIEANLREIVRRSRQAGAAVVLCGMDIPTNFGPDYTQGFAALYERVAADEGATLVPGFVREVGLDPDLLQPDGLHPTAEGQQRLAEVLLPAIRQVFVADQASVVPSSKPSPKTTPVVQEAYVSGTT
jgi:acyl-CoA thioesterase-1